MSYTNYNQEYRRSKLSEPAQLKAAYNLFTPTVDQKFMLGGIYETNQGDRYRYAKNGAVALGKALVVQAEAMDAQQTGPVQTAYGVAAGQVTFNILATTGSGIANDELIDGYLIVNDGGDAMGDSYVIKSNKWITGDTVMSVTIADEGGLRTAIAATDDVSFVKNQFRDVIVKPTTLTAPMVGVTLTTVPANYYFWAKVKGVTPCTIDTGDTVVVGEPIGHIDGSGTAGSVGLVSTHATDVVLGTCLMVATGAEVGLVNLQIPGM